MTRLFGAIVYNWPLKLMAIALATLLYGGLVYSQNSLSVPVLVPIQGSNQAADTILIGSLGEVNLIRYFVSDQSNVAITSTNFTARVDLSGIQPGPTAQSVKVIVESADPRIQVISAEPAYVSVKLERVAPKQVPVVVVPGPVPSGLDVQPPKAFLQVATVRGAESDIARVAAVRAEVQIDGSGIDIDRDFPLTPVDGLGEPVRGVDVEPATVRVTMLVFKDRTTATVPIVPTVTGEPAAGFEVVRVTLDVAVASLQGDAEDLANVATARTQPVSIDGRTSDLDASVAFDLPQGVTPVTPDTVHVHVTIRAVTESRTFTAGIAVAGARPDRTYALSVETALVTIGGSATDLDQLNGGSLSVTADVAGLDVGTHQVPLTVDVQPGLNVVAISPERVTIVVAEASGSAAPPSATP